MPRWRDAFRSAAPLALVSLLVTLLRLAGELRGWSEAWFSRATSGLVPVGAVSWLVGITWLALPFADTPRIRDLPFWTAYFGAAFIPQLVFWVAFTVVTGMLAGTVVAALRRGPPARGGSQ